MHPGARSGVFPGRFAKTKCPRQSVLTGLGSGPRGPVLGVARARVSTGTRTPEEAARGRARGREGQPADPTIPGTARRRDVIAGRRPGPEVLGRCRAATCGASPSGSRPGVAGETLRGHVAWGGRGSPLRALRVPPALGGPLPARCQPGLTRPRFALIQPVLRFKAHCASPDSAFGVLASPPSPFQPVFPKACLGRD